MGHYRVRSIENVISEIDFLIEKHSMREIYFIDDNLTANKERFKKILDVIIERKYDITWHAANGTAIFDLDDELINKMKESGCYKVILSIESGVQSTLDKMNKPVDLSKVKPVIDSIKAAGLKVESMFVIGLPGETKEDILKTIDFAENLGIDYVSFPIATPYPGTELYRQCVENGYLADDFSFKRLKFGIGNIRTPEFDPAFVEGVRKSAWQRINFGTVKS